MSYFATLLARRAGSWSADDVDLDDVESLDDLIEAVLEAADDADNAVLLVEHEAEWFGVVRCDPGVDDPRVYVSDAQAALRHALGEVLLPELVEDVDLDDTTADEEEAEIDDEDAVIVTAAPAGDGALLADLGLTPESLDSLVGKSGPATSEAVAAVAREIGAGEALESVR